MSNTALRTRSAIIKAALEIWPAAPRTSLNEIAEHAGVSRSTLHRHFVDREDLGVSLGWHVRELTLTAITSAEPSFGPALPALRRIVDALLDVGPGLVWLHEQRDSLNNPELHAALSQGLEEMQALLESARLPDDPSPQQWRSRVFWEILRVGAEFVQTGETRQQAVNMILFTLTNGTLTEKS